MLYVYATILPSLSIRVMADVFLPSLRLDPDVTNANITVKYSSVSTRLSELTDTDEHIIAPSAEPVGKVMGEDNGS